ncbi:RNA-directed DNA polymerase, eukaryota, reverse transcriptase zinc-binding domain protein, partial [Tanacetum coccineum]
YVEAVKRIYKIKWRKLTSPLAIHVGPVSDIGRPSKNSYHGGWTWVFGKNKNQNPKRIENPFERDIERVATSFFVTNFPESLDAKGLWKDFQSFGRIVDTFIANKRSKLGKRFGFVRFLGVSNEDTFVKKISNIWIESYHVFVSVAKFQRHSKSDPLPTKNDFLGLKKSNTAEPRKHVSSNGHPLFSDKQSYASVAIGDEAQKGARNSVNQDKGMKALTMSIYIMLEVYGAASPSFNVDERMVRINIIGLPLCACGNKCIQKRRKCVCGQEGDDQSCNMYENHNDVLDDFIEQIVEQKVTPKSTEDVQDETNGVNLDGSDDIGSKPLGFESFIKKDASPILNLKEVDEKRGNINTLNVSKVEEKGGIQEMKMTKLELFQLKSVWGNFRFDYACSMARGRAGSLVTMWDPNVFSKTQIWCSDNYVIVEGKWMNSVEDYYLINVYGPQQQPEKLNLWESLRVFLQNHAGNIILFGDLNEVRCVSERFGTSFSNSDVVIFNSFIQDAGLIDLPMGEFGQITTSFYYTVRILTLVRLLLKLFHSWFDRIGFDDVVKEAWNNFSLEVHGSSMSFHDKLRGLKSRLKLWYSHTKDSEHNRKLNTLHSLRLLDEKIDAGQANYKDRELCVNTMLELEGLDKIESMNLLQSSD